MSCNELDLNNSADGTRCAAVEVGFDYSLNVLYKDSSGSAIDLTGGTIQMIVKDSLDVTLLTLNHVVDRLLTGIFINSLAGGDFDIQISDVDTVTVGVGVAKYRVTFTDSVGLKHRISYGSLSFIDGAA